jgi:hypothetical protein
MIKLYYLDIFLGVPVVCRPGLPLFSLGGAARSSAANTRTAR